MPIGVKAMGTHPLKSSKRDPGLRDVPVTFGGVSIAPVRRQGNAPGGRLAAHSAGWGKCMEVQCACIVCCCVERSCALMSLTI